MDVLEAMRTRATTPPVKMGEPGPDGAALRAMVEAAAAAPDHGKLEPFRFLVVRGDARARLGTLFAESARRERPGATEAELRRQAEAPLRAPVLVVAVARVRRDHPKIPADEQRASAACAVQNLLLAAHALGFAAKWSTGWPASSPGVKAGLGLDGHEEIMAIVYLGTATSLQPPPPRPAAEALMREWRG